MSTVTPAGAGGARVSAAARSARDGGGGGGGVALVGIAVHACARPLFILIMIVRFGSRGGVVGTCLSPVMAFAAASKSWIVCVKGGRDRRPSLAEGVFHQGPSVLTFHDCWLASVPADGRPEPGAFS